MVSKYCPRCGRITSTSGVPNFCMWGCGSLADEPLLPDYDKWPPGGYYEMCKIAQKEYEERQKQKQPPPGVEIEPDKIQMRLF